MWHGHVLTVVLLLCVGANAVTNAGDKQALLDFKAAMNLGPNTPLGSWAEASDPCEDSWTGIVCNAEETRVIELNLGGALLVSSGMLTSTLGDLSELSVMVLRSNKLSGTLPPSLGNLAKLTALELDNNDFTGPIPDLSNLRELSRLCLHENQLSGTLGNWLGGLSKLNTVYLNGNHFTGTVPCSLGDLTQLTDACFSQNQFVGPIPETFQKLGALKVLKMERNKLNGTVPSALGDLKQLASLSLQHNDLVTGLPASFATHSFSSLSLYEDPDETNVFLCPLPACPDGTCGGIGTHCVAECSAYNDCSGHGLCQLDQNEDGFCVCDDGFATDDCSQCAGGHWGLECSECPDCAHGTCNDGMGGDGTCACSASWYGEQCDQQCPACVHGGCDDGSTGSGHCVCEDGFYGDLCVHVCACSVHGVCLHNGTCVCDDAWRGSSDCSACSPGHAGTQCQVVCPAVCSSTTPLAQRRGMCSEGLGGTGLCIACDAGYFGAQCAACACVRGTCADGAGGDGSCACGADWWGALCDQPCECSDHGPCADSTGVCMCDEAWRGAANCSECTHGRFGAACTGQCVCVHGTCDEGTSGDGTCTCEVGAFGSACNKLCPGVSSSGTACSGHGTCDDGAHGAGTCTCTSGWYSADCSRQCPDCGHGHCRDGATGDGSCVCESNWHEPDCIECVPNHFGADCTQTCPHCEGGGACNDGVDGTGACDCPRGLFGHECESKCPGVDVGDVCGNGWCKDGQNGTGVCSCRAGWYGRDCTHACPGGGTCSGHGVCDDGVDGTGRCNCTVPGFFGAGCELACACVHGACDDGVDGLGLCACDVGWFGPRCAHVCTCEAGHGDCDPHFGMCTCNAHWTGDRCDTCKAGFFRRDDTCVPCPNCGAHGQCSAATGECTCDAEWRGARCSEQCDCVHGTCSDDASCLCDARWNGTRCDECARNFFGPSCAQTCPDSCMAGSATAHGVCDDGTAGSGTCVCDVRWRGDALCTTCSDGWKGDACDERCMCEHGRCVDGGDCTCDAGWLGDHCDARCPRDASGAVCGGPQVGKCTLDAHNASRAVCQCNVGFVGDACELSCPRNTYAVCSGRGSCGMLGSTAHCFCEPGFVGDVCERACPSLFNTTSRASVGFCGAGEQRGQCQVDGTCRCNGVFRGVACDVSCPVFEGVACGGGLRGDCIFDERGTFCSCTSRFRGDQCQHACPLDEHHEPCGGPARGRCVGRNSATCKCAWCWGGDSCTKRTDVEVCGAGTCHLDTGLCSCGEGSFLEGSRCVSCPAGAVTNSSEAQRVEDCICTAPSQFLDTVGREPVCAECPAHAVSNGTGVHSCQCDRGFYGIGHELCKRCDPAEACDGGTRCHHGYSGFNCAGCADGFFKSAGRCRKCGGANWALFVLLLLALVALTAAGLRVSQSARVRQVMWPVGIGVTYVQLLSLLREQSGIAWPSAPLHMLELYSVSNYDSSAGGPQCVLGLGYADLATLGVLLPAAVLGVMGVLFLVQLALRGGSTARLRSRYGVASLLFLSSVYTFATSHALSWFSCAYDDAQGEHFLRADPNVRCHDAAWRSRAPLFGVMAALYGAGIPLLFVALLHAPATREQLWSDDVRARYGVLFSHYKSRFWYWRAVNTAKKFGVIVTILFATSGTLALVALLFVLFAFLCLHLLRRPYVSRADNHLESSVVFLTCCVLFCSLYFAAVAPPDRSTGGEVTMALLVVLALLGVLGVTVRAAWCAFKGGDKDRALAAREMDLLDHMRHASAASAASAASYVRMEDDAPRRARDDSALSSAGAGARVSAAATAPSKASPLLAASQSDEERW